MISDDLLEIISSALPETTENAEFCGGDGFLLMLEKCIKAIKQNLASVIDED